MNTPIIYISRDDHAKLRLLIASALRSSGNLALRKLSEELNRAVVIDPAAIPAGVVVMGSNVEFEDLGAKEVEEYTLVFPDQANIDEKRLSILTPIGTALLGSRVGDQVSWSTPGGIRHLKILRVDSPVLVSA